MRRILLLLVAVWVDSAPLPYNPHDVDAAIEHFLGDLYDRMQQSQKDIYDQMQGDQPQNLDGDFVKLLANNFTAANVNNMTDYFRTSRNRLREVDTDDRAKDNWIQVLKENILRQIGRSNMTLSKPESTQTNAMNMSMMPNFLNNSTTDDDHITEKIRSYYPSCDTPSNMDPDVWKDENVLNLYFNNFDDYNIDDRMNIATATLRLYRIPSENSTKIASKSADCDNINSTEEERLLRVSIFWYTSRRKKVKRRLSDSKVIQENAKWVELSVKPATRHWVKGRNLGLAVVVEDQEGNILRADRIFKGALCMVGASTPKPIPTIIIDAARQSNELDERIHSILGRNSTTALSSDVSMLPTIDICTLEFPENYNHSSTQIANLRINACNLKKSHEHAQLLAERDRLERLATLPELLSPRHIRHHRQHFKQSNFDPRPKIVNKHILTNDELQALNLNFTIHR